MTQQSKRHIQRLPVLSLSHLLQHYGIPVSAQKMRKLLVAQGYLVVLLRPSLRECGLQRKVHVLTGKGLLFGKNCRSAVHSIHTEPKFYPDVFGQLCQQLQLLNTHSRH